MARPRSISDQQIHDAAREVFVKHGPNAAVSLIAEKLAVSHAALFGRSGTKQRLMLEALKPGRPDALESLAESPPRAGARARLVDILIELMAFFRRIVPNLVTLRSAGKSMVGRPPEGQAPPPVALRRLLTRWLKRSKTSGNMEPPRAWAVAEGLLGAMEARCFNSHLGGSAFAPGTDSVFIRRLVTGLLGKTR